MLDKYEKPLSVGDMVAVLVVSSPIREEYRQAGLKALNELGLVPIEEPNPLAGCHYLSKPAHIRSANLNACLSDATLSAVWLARGGYGANLMLPALEDFAVPTACKKILGSSDGCYLLWYLLDRWQLPVYLAPMCYTSLTQTDGYDRQSLRWALFGEGKPPSPEGKSNKEFVCRGRLHGGCLSMLASLCGTAWMPDLSETLLIIEDINERPFRLERMIWQLAMSKNLDGVESILLGQFPGCFKDEGEKTHFYQRMQEILGPLGIPFAWDFALGHAKHMITLPLGVRGILQAENGLAKLFLE